MGRRLLDGDAPVRRLWTAAPPWSAWRHTSWVNLEYYRAHQHDVLSRGQLREAGFNSDSVGHRVAYGRWQAFGKAVVLHNGPLSREQRWWCAVLDQPQPCGLAGLSAAVAAGVRLSEPRDIHVLVSNRSRPRVRPGVVVHVSRDMRLVCPADSPPRTSAERAVIQAASWEADPRVAGGYFIAGFQQRRLSLRTATRELARVSSQRHVGLLVSLLEDIGDGAGSLAEVEFTRLARLAGLPKPIRQGLCIDASGRRRYLDIDYGLFAVEIDGPLHWRAESYSDGLIRQNALVRTGQRLLRFSTLTIRTDPEYVIEELRAAWLAFSA